MKRTNASGVELLLQESCLGLWVWGVGECWGVLGSWSALHVFQKESKMPGLMDLRLHSLNHTWVQHKLLPFKARELHARQ